MKPGLNGGSNRQIRFSLESEIFSRAAALLSSKIFLDASSSVALPRNEAAMQVSTSDSRKTTWESFGCGKRPKELPDGITKDTNQSSGPAPSFRWAAITGAVIAIASEDLLPFEIYLNSEEKAELEAAE